jgi:hypothetical protein
MESKELPQYRCARKFDAAFFDVGIEYVQKLKTAWDHYTEELQGELLAKGYQRPAMPIKDQDTYIGRTALLLNPAFRRGGHIECWNIGYIRWIDELPRSPDINVVYYPRSPILNVVYYSNKIITRGKTLQWYCAEAMKERADAYFATKRHRGRKEMLITSILRQCGYPVPLRKKRIPAHAVYMDDIPRGNGFELVRNKLHGKWTKEVQNVLKSIVSRRLPQGLDILDTHLDKVTSYLKCETEKYFPQHFLVNFFTYYLTLELHDPNNFVVYNRKNKKIYRVVDMSSGFESHHRMTTVVERFLNVSYLDEFRRTLYYTLWSDGTLSPHLFGYRLCRKPEGFSAFD